MSLIGSLNVGKTALAVHQAALQVTGNNIANAGNPDYTRQNARLSPAGDQQIRNGIFIGTGVNLESITRAVDESLLTRLRGAISDEQGAEVNQQWLSRVESVFNELSDQDLSTQLSTFFNSWSNLANKPQDIGLRQVVIQNGQGVASFLRDLRSQLGDLEINVDDRLSALALDANSLAQQIADINGQIVQAEGGASGSAGGLQDQRDSLLKRLSELIDIKTIPQESGVVNVYIGSEPLIINTDNRGVGLKQETVDGQLVSTVIFKASNGTMKLTSGQLGALAGVRTTIGNANESIDVFAGNLIFELNKLHASGQGLDGFSAVTSANAVDDSTLALNDPDSGLEFAPKTGSFVVHVRNKTTGLVASTLIKVDLDGLNSDDTTLTTLANDLDGVANVTASINAGKLTVSADSSDIELSFSQDSSGTLSALGVNNFFRGSDARDIQVSQAIIDKPSLLAAAKNGENGDNQTALAIAALEKQSIAALSGGTLKESYEAIVNGIATNASAARTNSEASRAVRETLEVQREATSGVSLDEEAINLIRQQRAFQAAARLVSTVNEMMETMLSIAR